MARSLEAIASARWEGPTNLAGSLGALQRGLPARGAFFLLSDFWDDSRPWEALAGLNRRGRRIVLCRVHGPEDLAPAAEGEMLCVDAETGHTHRVRVDAAARRDLAAAYEAWEREWAAFAARHGLAWVDAGGPLEEAVTAAVQAAGWID